MDRLGPSHDLKAARERAGLRQAPVDGGEHHVDDALGMGVRLAFRPQRRLVGPNELGDRQPALTPARQKLGPRAKGIRKLRLGRGRVFARLRRG